MRKHSFYLLLVGFIFLFGCSSSNEDYGIATVEKSLRTNTLITARSLIDIPYLWGGTSPQAGFDSSGFTYWIFARNGMEIPKESIEQFKAGYNVPFSRIRHGDVLFFDLERSGKNFHTAISTGDGSLVHSPLPGQAVKESFFTSYWKKYFIGARRYYPKGRR